MAIPVKQTLIDDGEPQLHQDIDIVSILPDDFTLVDLTALIRAMIDADNLRDDETYADGQGSANTPSVFDLAGIICGTNTATTAPTSVLSASAVTAIQLIVDGAVAADNTRDDAEYSPQNLDQGTFN